MPLGLIKLRWDLSCGDMVKYLLFSNQLSFILQLVSYQML